MLSKLFMPERVKLKLSAVIFPLLLLMSDLPGIYSMYLVSMGSLIVTSAVTPAGIVISIL